MIMDLVLPKPKKNVIRRAQRYYLWVNPMEKPPQRLVVDGREYLARRIVSMGDTEIIIEALDGTYQIIPRNKQQSQQSKTQAPGPQGQEQAGEKRF